jgi:tetratricopeptide (TPR) repeat protein
VAVWIHPADTTIAQTRKKRQGLLMQSLSFTSRAKASPFPPDDVFSAKWAALVQRSKRKLQLFKKKSDHVDLVREFEALIAERRAADDLPYAALVAMSLGRYLESCADSYAAGVYVEASEFFWEAAHQDAAHGCTDPPEVLRLHARDAHAKAVQGLESNKWVQSDVMLRAALHLCALEEWEEAGYLAEKAAEIERGLECMFDSHVALCVAARCYALSRNYAQVERVVKQMDHLAKQAAPYDGAWPGFVKVRLEPFLFCANFLSGIGCVWVADVVERVGSVARLAGKPSAVCGDG